MCNIGRAGTVERTGFNARVLDSEEPWQALRNWSIYQNYNNNDETVAVSSIKLYYLVRQRCMFSE